MRRFFHCTRADVKMGLLTWLRRLYSLDTLDTRFTASSSTPAKPPARPDQPSSSTDRSNAAKDGKKSEAARSNAPPPRWNSLEFYVYYIIIAVAVFMMFKVVVDVSKGECCSCLSIYTWSPSAAGGYGQHAEGRRNFFL